MNPSRITLPNRSPASRYFRLAGLHYSTNRFFIEEDVTRVHVLAGNHAEDGDVLRAVRQGQFNLHAVVVGISEDAIFQDVLDGGVFFRAASMPPIIRLSGINESD